MTLRNCLAHTCLLLLLASLCLAQQPGTKVKTAVAGKPHSAGAESDLKNTFELKVKAEWEALKKRDNKAYGELLADDYEGVEVDGQGERTKIQALNELERGNVYNYALFGLKVLPLGPDAAFVIYEVTMEFPPKAQVRYSRVYITELWIKRGGQWKELHYQETHVK
jgi:Domain of unknown function (DUF4440)